MVNNQVYKFKYVPVGGQPVIIRYIDLRQIVAVGMFVDREILGIQIDCKYRDAPLVIEVMPESRTLMVSEAEKLEIEMHRLVEAWSAVGRPHNEE